MPDPVQLVRRVTQVASVPTVFARLNDAINDPRSTNQDLTRIINEDAAMAIRLLRIANSALYNFPAKVETVTHAITVIGVNQLRDLVLACSVVDAFDSVPEELVSVDSFWRHSIACGVAARILAGLRRETNVERFFLAGLLHDIGRLVMYREMPAEVRAALVRAKETGELLYTVERDMFGWDHAKLGGLLMGTWQLPARLEQAVAYHHAPEKAQQFAMEASIVHVADIIANALELGTSGERLVPPLSAGAWEQLDLPASAMGTVMDQLKVQYDGAIKYILNG